MDGDGGGQPPRDIRFDKRRREHAIESMAVEVAEVVLPGDTEHELRVALGEIVRQNGQTAVILERLTNRIDTIDEWRKGQDKQREEDRRGRSYQRFWHGENESGEVRGFIAIGVAICAMLVNLLPHLHWG